MKTINQNLLGVFCLTHHLRRHHHKTKESWSEIYSSIAKATRGSLFQYYFELMLKFNCASIRKI